MYVGSTLAMMIAGKTVTMKMATASEGCREASAESSREGRYTQTHLLCSNPSETQLTGAVLHVLSRRAEVDERKGGDESDRDMAEEPRVTVLRVSAQESARDSAQRVKKRLLTSAMRKKATIVRLLQERVDKRGTSQLTACSRRSRAQDTIAACTLVG
jgi:hypothetical protein